MPLVHLRPRGYGTMTFTSWLLQHWLALLPWPLSAREEASGPQHLNESMSSEDRLVCAGSQTLSPGSSADIAPEELSSQELFPFTSPAGLVPSLSFFTMPGAPFRHLQGPQASRKGQGKI